jgi:hypothetical protein
MFIAPATLINPSSVGSETYGALAPTKTLRSSGARNNRERDYKHLAPLGRNDKPEVRETGVRFAICDSLLLASVVSLNDLGTAAPESQSRKPDPDLNSTTQPSP